MIPPCFIIFIRLLKYFYTDKPVSVDPLISEEKMLAHRSFDGFGILAEDDFINSRKPILVNIDLHISLAAPEKSMNDYFYKNADAR